jgi:phosphate transport system substrate-binding protein
MSRFITIFVLLVIFVGCKEGGDDKGKYFDFDSLTSPIIEGLTVHNYPKVDGSTSTQPLNAVIACILFGIDYKWGEYGNGLRYIEPALNENDTVKFNKLFRYSQTHHSFINLIDGEADLILVARTMSPDEKKYAEKADAFLTETPIALDALIFIVNPYNPIESLTAAQIQDIYTLNITNWRELGWNVTIMGEDHSPDIIPYVRNRNSGSQELMETLAMEDADITGLPVNRDELTIFTMSGAVDQVFREPNAICYTIYYYKEYMVTGVDVKSLSINGIYPNRETISDRSYPYAAEVYAVTRTYDWTTARQVHNWLQTEAGKQAIIESGYIPYNGE